ncbi:MAG: DinB family protein [Planctomycetia bacterium]|nr:DinB family protein [Planctomycetia bacterium]
MNAVTAIRTALHSSHHMLTWFVGDLSDADLLVRPTPGANHIAWQLGHLILAEGGIGAELPGVVYPALPAGFADQHGKDTAQAEPPIGFLSRTQYVDLFTAARNASLAALDKMTEADLDCPTQGKLAAFAPNLGALLLLISNHTLMHAGQFSVVRRKLGKPVLF